MKESEFCNLNCQAPKEEGKKKKKGGGKTVSSVYLASLMELMAQVSEGDSCLENAPILSAAQLRAPLCEVSCPKHAQEAWRSGTPSDCEFKYSFVSHFR